MEHNFPEPLAELATDAWQAILAAANPHERETLTALADSPTPDRQLQEQLYRCIACSRFAAESFRRRPWLLLALVDGGALYKPLRDGELDDGLADELAGADDAGAVLRRFRQRQMLRIVWRDLNRIATAQETMRDVSWLADACIRQALAHAHAELAGRFGTPRGGETGEAQELIVIAMGKLGAYELNLSSDIDLIFVYPERGATAGASRSLSNEEFFTRLGRALIALLDVVSAEGFVFRVDMRLRPYGDSGALVHSIAALETYYQEQGRDWERYALIKARPVTGLEPHKTQLMECLRPFVYRRYVDFSAIDSLRAMKHLIVAEVRRRGLHGNVKLGSGGIREIEFIAQCFQLIRGGRDRSLQKRELLPVLADCARLGYLPDAAVKELSEAYIFLRNTEHAIQAWEDKQTQELPADAAAQTGLAFSMGFSWDAFEKALSAHRDSVAKHFGELIAEVEESEVPVGATAGLWCADCDSDALQALGFSDAQLLAEQISTLYSSRRVQSLQAEGRERLDRFMPMLLEACTHASDPSLAVQRALPLVTAVARRSAYLLLLIENPPALSDLVNLCAASPWIAEQLTSRPALLDELLDRASLYEAPERDILRDELRQQLARLLPDDLEGNMDALRYFKAAHVLRVAASETADRLPLMKVSDKLSFIAEACLEQVLSLAWAQLTARHGEPSQESGREGAGTGFAVLAYGKLGGIELSYASDLDLVFVFDAPAHGSTSGPRSVDNATFYTRLGQRIIHILETRMSLGQLYETDMRLRPSGASGLLVSSFSAYEQYLRHDAWIWEHQALVRARSVCGDDRLRQRLEALREDVLCTEREPRTLANEVADMRQKMRDNAETSDGFDLKQGAGGIVDIEFMVQYAVLAWASRHRPLAKWSDNVRILETLAETGLLARESCEALSEVYLKLRSATHRLALQEQTRTVEDEEYAESRELVTRLWAELFGSA